MTHRELGGIEVVEVSSIGPIEWPPNGESDGPHCRRASIPDYKRHREPGSQLSHTSDGAIRWCPRVSQLFWRYNARGNNKAGISTYMYMQILFDKSILSGVFFNRH